MPEKKIPADPLAATATLNRDIDERLRLMLGILGVDKSNLTSVRGHVDNIIGLYRDYLVKIGQLK